jgi:hypothetical protein
MKRSKFYNITDLALNNYILQNEILTLKMNLFKQEILKLELLYWQLDEKRSKRNASWRGTIRRSICRSIQGFSFLNEAYDQEAHKNADINTTPFESEIQYYIDDLRGLCLRYSYKMKSR